MKWKWGREITQWWRLEFKVRFRQQISSTFNFRRGSFFILIAKSISPKFLFIWTKQRIICTDKNIKLKRHATTTTKKEKKEKNQRVRSLRSAGIRHAKLSRKRKPCIPVCWAWILPSHHCDLILHHHYYSNPKTQNIWERKEIERGREKLSLEKP